MAGYLYYVVQIPRSISDVGKMRNCGMRKVKCGIQKCGNACGMVGKMRIAEMKVYNIEHRIK